MIVHPAPTSAPWQTYSLAQPAEFVLSFPSGYSVTLRSNLSTAGAFAIGLLIGLLITER